ncbi:MAG TPA: acyl-CoA dehydrogenase, partial [Caulobacter sp.]|nr:acyl-CoA dehydrogenase [Caulobacter sp.]
MNAPVRRFQAEARLPDLDMILPRLTQAFAETAALYDREASFPADNFRRLHEAGLLALTAPARLGGL